MNHLELLRVHRFDKKCRCGEKADGGYVFAELEGEYDCYISAGINDEESFSRDFIEKYGLAKEQCYGFDGTIQDYPYHYTQKIQFSKKNISHCNDDHHSNLAVLAATYKNIFLKMDIEGGEYPWLLRIDEAHLAAFKQIVIEFHGITNDGWNCPYGEKVKCLEKLKRTHYIVHAHGNNNGPSQNGIPDVLELTYVRKSHFETVPEWNTQPLPIEQLDFPNRDIQDLDLNRYPFRDHSR
jgi:hypothetical protein